MPATSKKSTTKKTLAKSRSKSNVKSSIAKNKGVNWGVIAIVAGVLITISTFFVLLSQAGTTTNYKTADGAVVPRRFPGDPNPKLTKKAYWGSSIGGNSDPARHETPTGKSLSVRRTFWGWDNNRTSMINTIKADLSANRLPWVSTKTPKWAEVAAGKHDAVLDDMLRKVDATGGPVWLTIYHEPEDNTNTGSGREKCEKATPNDCDGTAADWRAMQKHVRDRMNTIGTKNIALAPILMSWTWDSRSNRTPSDYWVSSIWDIYGVDHYQDSTSGAVADSAGWKNFVSFTEAKGMPYSIGEWGTRGSDAAAGKRVQDFWNWGFANNKDLVAYSYFDSGLNSPTGSWELMGEQLTTFQNILKSDTRVQRIKELGTPTTSTTTPSSTITVGPTTTATTTPTTPPAGSLSINITSPKTGDSVKGLVNVTAEPADNMQEVSFRIGKDLQNTTWQTTDNTAPFAWNWDTTKSPDGEYAVVIRARKVGDPGNVYTEKSIKVNVVNQTITPLPPSPPPNNDTVKPSSPTSLKASLEFDPTRFSYVVNLAWSGSYDNVGVTGYDVKRNGILAGSSSGTVYKDTAIQVNVPYIYDVYAKDLAGNISALPGTTKITGRCFLIWCWGE
jgi:hypothetical protein